MLGRTLVTGRRTNVLIGNRSVIYLPNHVTTLARQRGRLYTPWAEDYFFIAFNDFPWHRVADVVIGRVGYDNYLVGLAIQQSVTVVDATSTILAFHQTDSEGNMAGHRIDDKEFNYHRIGEFNYETGHTTAIQYVTRFRKVEAYNMSKVVVAKRTSQGMLNLWPF